jgi:hypothetical protein
MMNSFLFTNIVLSFIIFFIEEIYSVEIKIYNGEEEPKINVTIISSYEVYPLWSEQEVIWESYYVTYVNRMYVHYKIFFNNCSIIN